MHAITFTFVLLTLGFAGCQSNLEKIGQEHATEVIKWQKLAEYAGNELKPLGLTITAGVQINSKDTTLSYSLINVQLNTDANNTEVDLLSPEFAEKFACNAECQNLGLYDSNFETPKTQLASFFFTEEGRFFEFYGKLAQLNELLAFYRASSSEILKKYLTLMLNRKMKFNSLSAFMQYLESHITEDNLLAFSKSGFISPVKDHLSPSFVEDLYVNIPIDSKDIKSAENAFTTANETSTSADKNWATSDNDVKMPNDGWSSPDNELDRPNINWITSIQTADELLKNSSVEDNTSEFVINANWKRAKQHNIQVGSIVCSFSDNSLGLVKEIDSDSVTLDVIAQARLLVDGMNLYPQSGYLFTTVESFNFVKGESNEVYPLSDIAVCSMKHITRGHV